MTGMPTQTDPQPQTTLARLRRRFSQSATELGAYLVIAAVSIVALPAYFFERAPTRWLVLALLLALLALEWAGNRYLWRWKLRGLPHVLLAIKAGLTVALMLIPPQTGIFVLLFFLLAVDAAMMFEAPTWLWWTLVLAILSAAVFVLQNGWLEGLAQALIYGAGFYFFASFALSTKRAETAQAESQRLLAELQAAHAQLQRYAAQAEELAVAEERNRLAREMHDTLGHRLTVSAVQLDAARRLIPAEGERAAAIVATVHEQVQEALAELRQTVAALRAPVEEDLALAKALQRLAAQFQAATALEIELDLPAALPALPHAHRKALYRAAQETLTNVQRHAQARRVWVSLAELDGSIVLHVGDDGKGLPPHQEQEGFGLRGLRERAAQLGGDFFLTPRPGGGAQATFHIPLPGSLPEQDHSQESAESGTM